MTEPYVFYPVCKNIQGKFITLFRYKKYVEKTSQNYSNSFSRSSFLIEEVKVLEDQFSLTLSYTNFTDILYELVIAHTDLKKMKGDRTWRTLCHELRDGIMTLSSDKLAFQGDDKDLMYVHVGQSKLELYEVREEKEKRRKLTQISVDCANFTQEIMEELRSKDQMVGKLTKEVENLKNKQILTDDSETKRINEKKRGPPPKSLINPNKYPRQKPTGAKIL